MQKTKVYIDGGNYANGISKLLNDGHYEVIELSSDNSSFTDLDYPAALSPNEIRLLKLLERIRDSQMSSDLYDEITNELERNKI